MICESAKVSPILRVSDVQRGKISKALDSGLHGIQVPNIGSRETFVEKKQDFPKYVPAWMKAAAKFNRGPNRKFFYDKVIGAGKIPGVDYTEEELEKSNQILNITYHHLLLLFSKNDLP